jgi:hypothetical protein
LRQKNLCIDQELGGKLRAREKRKKRDEWYRKGGYDSVIFEPATPGSELKRQYEKEIEEAGMKIKVRR